MAYIQMNDTYFAGAETTGLVKILMELKHGDVNYGRTWCLVT
jgi:hypothetical protein